MSGWRRLDPRMLLVHPLHEAIRELPLLVAVVVFGAAGSSPVWLVAAVWWIAAVGVSRWFTTTYRVEPDPDGGRVQLRTGLLGRRVLSVPRNRVRAVTSDTRLLYRALGLTVLRIGSGTAADAEVLELDGVAADEVARLRALLLPAGSGAGPGPGAPAAAAAGPAAAPGRVLARWRPSWLRFGPLSLSGLVLIAGLAGAAYQNGVVAAVQESDWGRTWLAGLLEAGERQSPAVLAAALVVAVAALGAARALLVYGNLVLARRPGTDGDVLQLRHGLLRVREHSFDMRRLRGGTLRRPLLVRLLGGARLDGALTGVAGVGEASMLLPPCPAPTARAVLIDLVGAAEPVTGPLRRHGPAAVRRRFTRALLAPVLAGVVLAVAGVPAWWWAVWAVVVLAAVGLAADRVAALGHRVDARWLVASTGSFEQRRYCIDTAGIVGWTVRQSWFQRRAGVATLVAATAAGVKAYRVLDVPVAWAWAVAAEASPWVVQG